MSRANTTLPPDVVAAIDLLADYGVRNAARGYPHPERLRASIAGAVEVQFTDPDYEQADAVQLDEDDRPDPAAPVAVIRVGERFVNVHVEADRDGEQFLRLEGRGNVALEGEEPGLYYPRDYTPRLPR